VEDSFVGPSINPENFSKTSPRQLPDPASVGGLSSAEASSKIMAEGYNELPSSQQRSIFSIILGVIHEPMFLLLVASGLLYFVLGDVSEGLMLMSFVLIVIGITVYQEQKTERALEALKNLASPRALVIRDSEQKRVAGREVVTGDMLILAEDDRVPADAILLVSNNIFADESLLTGESVPVRKVSWTEGPDSDRPGGDDQPFVYSGTLIVSGQGLARVRSTGIRTEMGKIGAVLTTLDRNETRLKVEISRMVKTIALAGAMLCAVIVIVYGLTRNTWIEGFLAGINACNGNPSRRVPGRADDLSCARGLADVRQKRAHPSCPGNRDAGFGNCSMCRQDGNPDTESYVGKKILCTEPDV